MWGFFGELRLMFGTIGRAVGSLLWHVYCLGEESGEGGVGGGFGDCSRFPQDMDK